MKHKRFSQNILIDPSEPFKNDFTGELQKISKAFTGIIEVESKRKPLVISIDAPWGVGKTTFIDMWGEQLRQDNKLAIKFDAWKCDHSDYALLAIIAELTQQLEELKPAKKYVKEIKKNGISLCKAFIPATSRLALNFIMAHLKLEKAAKEFVEELRVSVAEQVSAEIEEYQNKAKSLMDFKDSLAEACKKNTLFLFVDELDRCKPTFAISIIEIIKHFFDIENLCCIISTNIQAFSKSINKVYGYNPNEAKRYLERFIDIPIKLPEPKEEQFIDHLIKNRPFKDGDDPSNGIHKFNPELISAIKKCCSKMALRVIEKYFRDIQIFIDKNDSLSDSKKIPLVYYGPIAFLIAKKRINSKKDLEYITTELNKDLTFKWAYNFLELSKQELSLVKKIEELDSELTNRYERRPSTTESNDAIQVLENIKKNINNIYGNIMYKPSRLSQTVSKTLSKYQNHYKAARGIIDLTELIND